MGNEWKRGDSEIQVVCFLKRAFFLCLSSWCRTGCLVGSKPVVLLNNFTHSPFFCPREVCQSSCEAAVAQVLVPSLEDQREARQGWWFQLGAIEKRVFFFSRNIFPHIVFPWLFKWELQLFYCFAVALPRHNWTAPVRRCWSWCNSWIERPNMAEMVQKVETENRRLPNDPILRKSSKVGQAVDGALLSRLVEFADMAQRREYAQVGFGNLRNQRDCTTDERNVLRIERAILTLSRHDKFHSTNVCMGWPPWDA